MKFKNLLSSIALLTPLFTSAATPEVDLAKIPLCGIGTISGVTPSSPKITDNPFAYQSGFDASTWSGKLRKLTIKLDDDGGVVITTPNDPVWDAGTLLNTQITRSIFTINSANKTMVSFEFHNLAPDVQALFNLTPDTTAVDNLGVQRVSYLRGVREKEHATTKLDKPLFRVRNSVLGDIINSSPVYVAAPARNIIGSGYQAFYDQNKSRSRVVYVGANDGMLHAFHADTGTELFAYIPSPLLKKLPLLTDPNYAHVAFMDGNITVSEAQLSGTWKTVLAAGMGAGHKGVFALDVTNPGDFKAGLGELFEFTDDDDSDIGYITSAPLIAKIRTSKNNNGSFNYKNYLVTASGYNANTTDGYGDGYLFLLSLDKDKNTAWQEKVNYYKIKAPNTNEFIANALAAPGLALHSDGSAIYAYAGDLKGNLWRFDFTGGAGSKKEATAVFTAKDHFGKPQSITAQPVIAFAPGGGYLILFGTGKYVENADTTPANFTPNSFYAVRDSTDNKDITTGGRNDLAKRTLAVASINGVSGYTITGDDFSYGTASGTKKGWYVDFLKAEDTGELSITPALLVSGKLFFNTLIPGANICEPGFGATYTLDILTGKASQAERITGLKSQIGLLSIPVLIFTDNLTDDRDALGRRNNTTNYSVLNFGTGGVEGSSEVSETGNFTAKAGRLSWREIQNWQELQEAILNKK
ncbi:pilus assembly protein [Solimicrobium silvestre]|uniref:Neisseria PilC beta-propeller domain n=1 Tax=Solimicrobium silvestre TaxID=2099400 RepID=A0A2S9H550_9BURK|nr:PilC/PilY family type IV pilus protein [Solimicrobium silvestre]PRC95053.1 Neisseria PilC beta-propeller domain [Solimicrobium silvestre]